MRIAVILCVLSALATGCTGVQTPTARVRDARVLQQSPEGSSVELTIELVNPNRVPLPLIEADYTVTTTGGEPFNFTYRLNRTLPASGVQTIQLPAVFKGERAGAAYTAHGSVSYQPPGEIPKLLTDSGIPRPSADFKSQGNLAQATP